MPDLNDLNDSTAVSGDNYPVYYKHKMAAAFRVGPHQFADHLYQINDAKTHEDFLREFDGLLEVDRVQINEVLNVQNERPVSARRVIRDSYSTDKSGIAEMASATERNGELERREAVVAARFKELGTADDLAAKLAAAEEELTKLRAAHPAPVPAVTESTDAHVDDLNKNLAGSESETKDATPAPKPALGGLRLGG